MQEIAFGYHNLEWPPAGTAVAGPILWLRGWAVGRAGVDLVDVRIRHEGATHRGILGLPRIDLVAHFGSKRRWLPAEYIIGVPVTSGDIKLVVEFMSVEGAWHPAPPFSFTVTAAGSPPPRVEGRVEASPDGTWTLRDAHHPFHGHLDLPGNHPRWQSGRLELFGWLLDEVAPISTVVATTDLLVFNHLAHSQRDESLARKFPEYRGSLHARLHGGVDWPAGLTSPACLRVYAIGCDGTPTLCFGQRVTAPAGTKNPTLPPVKYVPPTKKFLPEFPSGRPHRILMMVRSLWPADATLRALDLARHLQQRFRWAVRLVATEDGPLREVFFSAGVESLIVDPTSFFTAADGPPAARAFAQLGHQIRWDHLDAVAVFDPSCGWALAHAAERGIPSLFDCNELAPLQADPTAGADVQTRLSEAWRRATAVCFSSQFAARAQAQALAGCPAKIIVHWHTPAPGVAGSASSTRRAHVGLRAADWLHRHHPATAARWEFSQGPATTSVRAELCRLDEKDALPAMVSAPDWDVNGLEFFVGPQFGRGPFRPVLDALAAGIPTVLVDHPLAEEFFGDLRLGKIREDNPMAAAHALLSYESLPDSIVRPSVRASHRARAAHDPSALLPQWVELLCSVAADRG